MIKTIIRNLLKPLSFLPAILMMYLIFSFSAQDGTSSAQLSYKVSYKIVEVAGDMLGADFEPWEIENLANRFHGPIRKIAHMTEYFALAVSVAFPLYVYGLRGFLLLIVAGLFCVAFACADEYHQSMVAGRSPSKKDVVIDSIGIFAGIIFTRIIGWTGRKTIFRPLAKSKKKKKANQMPNQEYSDPQMYNRQPNPGYPNQPMYYWPPNQRYLNQPGQQFPPYHGMNQSRPGYHDQPGPSYYGPPPYDFPPQPAAKDDTSDRLSEDMSFKKLVHDLKDKKQTERHLSHKPRIHKSDYELNEFEESSIRDTISESEPAIEEIDFDNE